MSQHDEQRRRLLGRLNRHLAYTAPLLALVAGGAVLPASADDESAFSSPSEVALLLASHHMEEEAQAEGAAEAQGDAEAEGEAEGEAEAQGEAEGEAEAEGGASAAVARPEGYSPAYRETGGNPAQMLARGEALYNDTSLSSNGLACASCHGGEGQDTAFNPTFQQPFPHRVAMAANRFGMPEVHADEMVQICMVAPMAAEPLEWGSEELTSLAAYVVEVQKRFAGEPHDL